MCEQSLAHSSCAPTRKVHKFSPQVFTVLVSKMQTLSHPPHPFLHGHQTTQPSIVIENFIQTQFLVQIHIFQQALVQIIDKI